MGRREGVKDYPMELVASACSTYWRHATAEERRVFNRKKRLLLSSGPSSDALSKAFQEFAQHHWRLEATRRRATDIDTRVFRRLVQRWLSRYLQEDAEFKRTKPRRELGLSEVQLRKAAELLGTPQQSADGYRYDLTLWHVMTGPLMLQCAPGLAFLCARGLGIVLQCLRVPCHKTPL